MSKFHWVAISSYSLVTNDAMHNLFLNDLTDFLQYKANLSKLVTYSSP